MSRSAGMRRRALVIACWAGCCAAIAATLPTVAAGQSTEDTLHLQRATSAGGNLVHWTIDEGLGEQTIFIKNTSADRAITVVSWRVYQCRNIRPRNCAEHKNGPTIKPGETVRLEIVRSQNAQDGYPFNYEMSSLYADEAGPKP